MKTFEVRVRRYDRREGVSNWTTRFENLARRIRYAMDWRPTPMTITTASNHTHGLTGVCESQTERPVRVFCATLECMRLANFSNRGTSYTTNPPTVYYLCDECEAARKSKEQDAARLSDLENRSGCGEE